MSEEDQRRSRSPLESERGRTTVKDGVVSKIAGVAAGEVEGILLGSNASRSAGSILGGVAGSGSASQGISAEVGRTETAIDVTMGIKYGENVSRLAERVRSSVTERVENLTGLRVTELNVTVSDVVFPEGEGDVRPTGDPGREREAAGTRPVDPGAARTEAATRAGSRFGEEPVRADDKPPEEDETTELRLDDEETGRR